MLTILIGVLVGIALGLTGGGGSIIAVPALVYILGLPVLQATAVSLASVTAMAMVGAIEAARRRMIEIRASLLVAGTGICFAPLGVYTASFLDATTLLLGFATLMLVIAALMWLKSIRDPRQASVVRANFRQAQDNQGAICRLDNNQAIRLTAPCGIVISLCGAMTGFFSGLFGVGGGFLIVPALTTITRLGIHRAVASSLFIIALTGLSGVVATLFQDRTPDFTVAGLFICGGLAGMTAGRLLAPRLPAVKLQKFFAAFVLSVGLVTLGLNL